MTDDLPQPPELPPLAGLQASRVDFARRDLEYARAEDLAQLDADGLILLVEKLRRRLGDMLDLVDEMTERDTNIGD
ncbi:hypothetical protein [Streptomyces sp. NPDC002573]|uniref:hypothetical protein n=1 Tax=Streptomyces sp. NPDC002573 TaxID=3364651 RepID=UPI003678295C